MFYFDKRGPIIIENMEFYLLFHPWKKFLLRDDKTDRTP